MIGYRYQYEYVSLEVYSQIHTSRQILLKQMCFVSVGSWYRCLIHLNFCTHYLFDDPNKMNNWDCIFDPRWGPYVNCSLLYWLYPGVSCSIGGIVWIKASCTLTTRKTRFMRKNYPESMRIFMKSTAFCCYYEPQNYGNHFGCKWRSKMSHISLLNELDFTN